ncbi:hypothetical protein NUACC21_41790 [Scytonema sp. NUACC21]
MKLTQFIAVAAAGVTLSLTAMPESPTYAATFTEVGDSGQSLSNAINVGVDINAIVGTIDTTTDVDLYQLNLADGLFIATTVRNVTNNLDTMLWLFDSKGKGIVGNDDSSNTSQSTIRANLSGGTYYLGISNYDIEPTSAMGFIFDYTSGSQKTKLLQPTGPGGSATLINNWTIGPNGSSPRATGKYRILLNNSTVKAQPVSEPNAVLGLATLCLSGLLFLKKVASSYSA